MWERDSCSILVLFVFRSVVCFGSGGDPEAGCCPDFVNLFNEFQCDVYFIITYVVDFRMVFTGFLSCEKHRTSPRLGGRKECEDPLFEGPTDVSGTWTV